MLEEQEKSKNEIAKFKESSKPKALNQKISRTFENAHKLLVEDKQLFMASNVEYCQ